MSTKKKSKAKNWVGIIIIAIIVIGIVAFLLMKPASTSYENATAKTGDLTTYYSFSGNVESKNRQSVMSENIMQISEILVGEGETVKEGDVLIKTTTGDEIKAKINGEILNINVEENQQFMAGAKLLEIVDYNDLEINVKVDEYDISALEEGKETTVNIGAINKEIKGSISSMSKEGQVLNGIAFFTATIDLEQDDTIKIGMSAEVKLISNMATDVVILPMVAIQFDDNNNPYVLTKDEKDTIVETEITTGINDGTSVEIKSGILNEEKIFYNKATVAGGMGFTRPGSTTSGGDE